MSDAPIHPRHPGRGQPTSLIRAEGADGDPETGGVIVFLPSGASLQIPWRSARPIQPTLEAAKLYAAKIIEHLIERGLTDDVNATNWASVTAAIQRVILDFNDGLKGAITRKIITDLGQASVLDGMLKRLH